MAKPWHQVHKWNASFDQETLPLWTSASLSSTGPRGDPSTLERRAQPCFLRRVPAAQPASCRGAPSASGSSQVFLDEQAICDLSPLWDAQPSRRRVRGNGPSRLRAHPGWGASCSHLSGQSRRLLPPGSFLRPPPPRSPVDWPHRPGSVLPRSRLKRPGKGSGHWRGRLPAGCAPSSSFAEGSEPRTGELERWSEACAGGREPNHCSQVGLLPGQPEGKSLFPGSWTCKTRVHKREVGSPQGTGDQRKAGPGRGRAWGRLRAPRCGAAGSGPEEQHRGRALTGRHPHPRSPQCLCCDERHRLQDLSVFLSLARPARLTRGSSGLLSTSTVPRAHTPGSAGSASHAPRDPRSVCTGCGRAHLEAGAWPSGSLRDSGTLRLPHSPSKDRDELRQMPDRRPRL